MKEVSELLPDVLRDAAESGELLDQLIFAMWGRIAGNGVADHATPWYFQQGVLTVAVPTETWKKQLESMHETFINKINAQLKQRKLERIEFVIRPNQKLSPKKANPKATTPVPAEPPTPTTIEQAGEIRDKELRELFTKIAVQNLNLQSSKKTKP